MKHPQLGLAPSPLHQSLLGLVQVSVFLKDLPHPGESDVQLELENTNKVKY